VAGGQGGALAGQAAADGGADAPRTSRHEGHALVELVAHPSAEVLVLHAVDERHGGCPCAGRGRPSRTSVKEPWVVCYGSWNQNSISEVSVSNRAACAALAGM